MKLTKSVHPKPRSLTSSQRSRGPGAYALAGTYHTPLMLNSALSISAKPTVIRSVCQRPRFHLGLKLEPPPSPPSIQKSESFVIDASRVEAFPE